MTKVINITVENKLVVEKRDINVYHQATRSAHLISHNNVIDLPLKSAMEDDYLHLSMVSGPGVLNHKCIINLPSWADFEFSHNSEITVIHDGDRTLLKIPPGMPTWQLKLTGTSLSSNIKSDRITVGDDWS